MVGKLKTVRVDVVNRDRMKVRWRLDCTDRVGIVTGYRIAYCAIDSDKDTSDCREGSLQTEDVGAAESHHWITGLKPWTHYKVGVSVLTRAGASELSDYLVNRTRRDRPGSAPRDLSLELADRNSVRLGWRTPAVPNGPITSYEIRYGFVHINGRTEETVLVAGVDRPELDYDDAEGKFGYALADLKFYADYSVAVRACTTLPDVAETICGWKWAEDGIKTGIGSELLIEYSLLKAVFYVHVPLCTYRIGGNAQSHRDLHERDHGGGSLGPPLPPRRARHPLRRERDAPAPARESPRVGRRRAQLDQPQPGEDRQRPELGARLLQRVGDQPVQLQCEGCHQRLRRRQDLPGRLEPRRGHPGLLYK